MSDVTDLKAEVLLLRKERDFYFQQVTENGEKTQRAIDALNAENAKLRKENDTLCHRIDELCMEVGRLRRTAKRIVVSNKATDHATGHSECSACGGAIDYWDEWCRHCGARLGDA